VYIQQDFWGDDPRPDEIEAMCEEIQRGWTEEERIERMTHLEGTVPDYIMRLSRR
jgi:hypothetical protein